LKPTEEDTMTTSRKRTAKPAAHVVRETWLLAAVEVLRPIFAEAGYELPEHVRISTGFGLTLRGENATILAQVFGTSHSRDHFHNVFVSPVLEAVPDVLGALAHELLHIGAGVGEGHGKAFVDGMKKLGFDGKPTEALPSTETVNRWVELAADLGAYPHVKLELFGRRTSAPEPGDEGDEPSTGRRGGDKDHTGPAPQGTRMIKVSCSVDDESKWTVRQSRGNADKWGIARCGCHGEPGRMAP
jgi:hypothetical protein